MPQNELRKSKSNSVSDIIAFVSTHNPNNPNIFPLIKNSVEQLKMSNIVAHNKNFINAKKQPPNLQRILCKSQYISKDKIKVTKCGKNCVCCDYICECTEYKFKHSEKVFKIRSPFSCISSNVIYIIICSGCQEEYIGQTSRTLKERLGVYREAIRHPKYERLPVEKHLRECGKGKFNMFPILQVRKDDKLTRECIESKFIAQHKPKLNSRILN